MVAAVGTVRNFFSQIPNSGEEELAANIAKNTSAQSMTAAQLTKLSKVGINPNWSTQTKTSLLGHTTSTTTRLPNAGQQQPRAPDATIAIGQRYRQEQIAREVSYSAKQQINLQRNIVTSISSMAKAEVTWHQIEHQDLMDIKNIMRKGFSDVIRQMEHCCGEHSSLLKDIAELTLGKKLLRGGGRILKYGGEGLAAGISAIAAWKIFSPSATPANAPIRIPVAPAQAPVNLPVPARPSGNWNPANWAPVGAPAFARSTINNPFIQNLYTEFTRGLASSSSRTRGSADVHDETDTPARPLSIVKPISTMESILGTVAPFLSKGRAWTAPQASHSSTFEKYAGILGLLSMGSGGLITKAIGAGSKFAPLLGDLIGTAHAEGTPGGGPTGAIPSVGLPPVDVNAKAVPVPPAADSKAAEDLLDKIGDFFKKVTPDVITDAIKIGQFTEQASVAVGHMAFKGMGDIAALTQAALAASDPTKSVAENQANVSAALRGTFTAMAGTSAPPAHYSGQNRPGGAGFSNVPSAGGVGSGRDAGGSLIPPSGGGGGGTGGPIGAMKGSSFDQKAGGVVQNLMSDFGLTKDQAAGLVGNLGAESGLTAIQEKGVAAGTGGFGWAQWTGDRRVKFNQYVAENKLDPTSDEANYGFLRHELSQPNWQKFMGHLKSQTSRAGSSNVTLHEFESPSDQSAEMEAKRQGWANRAFASNAPDAAGAPGATPAVTAAGAPIDTGADQSKRPEHQDSTVTINGQSFRYGSGGVRGSASIPYGDYPVDNKGLGSWGVEHGALNINHGVIPDSKLGRDRLGIYLHAGMSDKLITEGCMALAGKDYPVLKAQVLKMIADTGHAYLHVGPQGATITPLATIDQATNATGSGAPVGAATGALAAPDANTTATGSHLPDVLGLSGKATQPPDVIAKAKLIAAGADPATVLGYPLDDDSAVPPLKSSQADKTPDTPIDTGDTRTGGGTAGTGMDQLAGALPEMDNIPLSEMYGDLEHLHAINNPSPVG
jgi:hypothetical protein